MRYIKTNDSDTFTGVNERNIDEVLIRIYKNSAVYDDNYKTVKKLARHGYVENIKTCSQISKRVKDLRVVR